MDLIMTMLLSIQLVVIMKKNLNPVTKFMTKNAWLKPVIYLGFQKVRMV